MTKSFDIWKSFTVLQLVTAVVAVATGGTPFWPQIPPSSILTSHGPPLLNEAPTVGTANGPFAGFVTKTSKGDPVYNYLGIPYALPPTGPLRFRAPEPIDQVSDIVKDATQLPPACPQPEGATALSVSEDCLYLNVFTTASPANARVALPVMVFIHGGNFITGDAGSVTGTRLLAHGGGVLVSVHYRLGALGFLSTGDQVSPGNYGLKDIALALKWVRKNIESFGGNPENVTVFGVSAGSAASLLMMLSPLTQGLVHGVIAQSGTPFDTWNAIKDPLSEAEELAGELDCSGKSSQEIMDCLRSVPWEKITAVTSASWAKSYGNYDTRLKYTLPVIERNVTGAFITADPVEILKSGNFNRIPIIIGNIIQEGLSTLASFYQLTVGPHGYDKDPANYKQNILIPIIKGFNKRQSRCTEVSKINVDLIFYK